MIEKENPGTGATVYGEKGKRAGESLIFNITTNAGACQSAAAQRQRILAWLLHCPITTLQARAMGIMHPGMRICELRKQGQPIKTEIVSEYCAGGVLHRIARYSLEAPRGESCL